MPQTVQWPIFISGAKGDPSNYDGICISWKTILFNSEPNISRSR